ncbi:MAG: hypothetical protein Q9184_002351 [Pyrenodesmia sp. 2 TL-2023]
MCARDRNFLFLDMVSMKSMADGRPVEACIKRTDGRPSKDAHAHPESTRSKPATPGVSNGNTTIAHQAQKDGAAAPHVPLPDNIKAILQGQRKDIDRIMTSVDNLLQDMKTMKATMEYLKFQQKTFATYNDHEAEGSPSAVTEELQNLTERVSHVTAKADKIDALTDRVESLAGHVSQITSKPKRTDGLSEEMRDLSKACSRLHKRVNEVDCLKLEIKLMRRRIKQLEDVNDHRPTSNMASRWGAAPHSSAQTRSEPMYDDNDISPEVPPSTIERSQTAPVPSRTIGSDRTIPSHDNSYDYMSDVSRAQAQHDTQYLDDKDQTPEANLVDILRPQITSAEKVAAHKRRLAQDSSSSSSSANAPPRRKVGRPRIHPQPDWTTKPSFKGGAKKRFTRLNDREHVLTSDPEDSDFDPFSVPDDMHNSQTKDGAKAISKAPLRIPTPEWEKSDWEGPHTSFTTSNTRGKSTARRGVSGRGLVSDREDVRRRSSGYGYGDDVSARSPEYWDGQSPAHSATPDLFAKPRDAQGRLLRPNGKVDGRSLRHQREREARAKLAAQLQQTSNQERPRTLAPPPAQGLATGSSTPASGSQYIDAAALEAAGYKNLAATPNPKDAVASTMHVTTLECSAGALVKQEPDTSGPPGSASMALATAPLPQSGGDKHVKLMNQVFPWR